MRATMRVHDEAGSHERRRHDSKGTLSADARPRACPIALATPAVLATCIAIYLFPLALLAVIFLHMRGFAHALWRIGARSCRHA
jgi:hypothetical protein